MSPQFPLTRRGFLGGVSALAATAVARPATARAADADVPLHWLDGKPAAPADCTFGVPWPRGSLARTTPLALHTTDGVPVPLQSWPLAYWPDGSVKWSGHAVTSAAEAFRLGPGTPAPPPEPVAVHRSPREIVLTDGTVEVKIATAGPVAVPSFSRAGRIVAKDGELVLRIQDRPDDETRPPHREDGIGVVERAEIEQSGPVRAVVKLAGRYQLGARTMLPWTMRISLGTGGAVRVVHSFRWDADENHVFVRGLGLRFSVPLTGEAHDRHVRFGTAAGGVWGEPVRVLTGLRRDPGAAVRAAQTAGTATPPVAEWGQQVRDGYRNLALWNDFTLVQESARHFAVWKRTSAEGSWLRHAGRGDRASGFGYVGGTGGGLGFGLRDFWQRAPRSLDIRGAATDTASVTLWSYSPLGPAMDLRTYDTFAHGLDLSYEDVQAGFATPQGMVRSTEMRLWALEATPSRDAIPAFSTALTAPPQLVTRPETYHAAGVFGRWSLPDRSTPARAALEDGVAREIAFYADQAEEREWSGFWHHGDVMHTYDADRHERRYDVGGYAWDNAELGTDALLWYAFLRSGDPRTFRLAHAMTRHVSEVDTHHAGRFAGLGSRHAVVHWGDGAKETRVGESFTKRFSYYLTADELLGELIRSSLQADETLRAVDPLREVLPPQPIAPARLRIGPDWYALVSNWLAEWERTGDVRWRDRIVTGMRDIAAFPAGLFTGEAGGAVGFDPATGHLVNFGKGDFDGGYNLAMAFLGEQILWEALDLVDVPEFRRTYLDFARYAQAPAAEKIARYGRDFNPGLFKTIYARVTAWAGEQLGNASLRRRGWEQFTSDPAGKPWPPAERVGGTAVASPVTEIPGGFATNDFAQRNLAIIALLAIAPEEAP
ncbi:exo-rhamnogalacturonan lyase family protein [Amycolatopsis lexingtonensis]|uniref:exo-rhamnogalacturonan lyase family protein n=1 Tax=Amycolatopsis lexingtonensis TaxID=218822 RepID=UPI003F72D66A